MKWLFPHRERAPVQLSRRSFLMGALATPVIVRAASLMPVQQMLEPANTWGEVVSPAPLFELAQPEKFFIPVWNADGTTDWIQMTANRVVAAGEKFPNRAPHIIGAENHPQIEVRR